MKIGHARHCITPQNEFYLIGYRSDNRYEPATGVHDDIYCNALLFEQEDKEVFVFSADVLEFEEEMAEDVKTMLHDQFGIERDLILLCATHDHSSIVSYHKGWYTKKFDQAYYDFFLETIVKSYMECKENKQEATMKYGKETIVGYYGNRNHPGELADNEVIVVKFFDFQGNAFAGLINWAVHSTVISAENTQLTSELAGEVSKHLYPSFGFYPAMIVGAAGDCSNRNERQGNDFAELARVSNALAQEIAAIPVETSTSFKDIRYLTIFHTIHHHMEFVHTQINEQIQNLKQTIAKQDDEQTRNQIKKRIHNLEKELEVTQFHLDAKCSVIDMGAMQFFVFPGELGSAFGIALKQACANLGLIFGYTNGYYEYFMPKEEYGLSFETIGCKVPKGEAEKLIEKLKQASRLLSNS